MSRPTRTWEFTGSFGQKAGIFGHEDGELEAWVYPLKLLRNFHLVFHIEGREVAAASISRTLTVRPESTIIHYAYDQFTVDEIIMAPVNEMGAVIQLSVHTYVPLQIEARYRKDFQFMWPAGLGWAWESWNEKDQAFLITDDRQKFVALVGSPNSTPTQQEYVTNYGMNSESGFLMPLIAKGTAIQTIAMAASVTGTDPARAEYKHLLTDAAALQQQSAMYYRDLLDRTVSVDLPDKELQSAYDWARISVVQGMVQSPFLGTGLVAGYRISGDTTRPGYAWYFGRDSEWTEFALNAMGDFADTKTALTFLMKFQRDDGRVPHEISQSASFVNWFKDYPFGFASADATPLLIIAVDDYVTRSGDLAFANENWDHVTRAYSFLQSTYNPQGFPRNFGVGHGWIEGGPLLPVQSELYQSGLAVEAIRALDHLARVTGKSRLLGSLQAEYNSRRDKLNQAFWIPDQQMYALALSTDGKPVAVPSVLSTVPMWFGLLAQGKANQMIDKLAAPDHTADWGTRITSENFAKYDPSGYHYGSVWPLFTGWAAVGEYEYHRPRAAFQNLKANALLTFSNSLGHVTEVMSGAYNQQHSVASPHQIWSAAMIISPLLRGMMGLANDNVSGKLTFAPHVPAEWTHFSLHNVPVQNGTVDLAYSVGNDGTIELQAKRNSAGQVIVEFSPALSPIAQVTSAEVDGRPVQLRMQSTATDQHASVAFTLTSAVTVVRLHVLRDFGITVPVALPPLGASSQGMKIVSESWTADRSSVTYELAGIAGERYKLTYRGVDISTAEGTTLDANSGSMSVVMPSGAPGTWTRQQVTLHFKQAAGH